MGTPDALHMATCLLYEDTIDQIHSYDPHFPKKFAWLGLKGTPTYPFLEQTTLNFPDDDSPLVPGEELDPLVEEGIDEESVTNAGDSDEPVVDAPIPVTSTDKESDKENESTEGA